MNGVTTATLEVPEFTRYSSVRESGETERRSAAEQRGDDWSVNGEPLRDNELHGRIAAGLREVAMLPGFEATATLDDERDFGAIESTLGSAYDKLAGLAGSNHVAVIAPADRKSVV